MKIYKSYEEAKKDVVNNTLRIEGNVKLTFNLKCSWNIDAENIYAWNIDAENIDAGNIDAWDINAKNIDAQNIDAENINAWNIDAWNIDAKNIDAENINAWDINAWNIEYYAICIAYKSLKCASINGRRKNSIYKCLDGVIEYKNETCKECG